MFVNGLGTANPTQRYSKADCWEAFKLSDWFGSLHPRSRTIAELVLTKDNGISFRALAVPTLAGLATATCAALSLPVRKHPQGNYLAHQGSLLFVSVPIESDGAW